MSSPFYVLARFTVGLFFRTFWRMRTLGAERAPLAGPLVVAANHTSYFDPPVVAWALPRPLHFMAKKELFDIPAFGPMISALNAYPVDRSRGDVGAIKRSVEILKKGNAVLVFPEGTRNRDGTGRAHDGAALLASLSGAPVLPVYIQGTLHIRHFDQIKVVIGEPFHPGDGRKASREDLAKRTDEIMERIHALRERL